MLRLTLLLSQNIVLEQPSGWSLASNLHSNVQQCTLNYLTGQSNHVTSLAQRSSMAPYCFQERGSIPALDIWSLMGWYVAPSLAFSLASPPTAGFFLHSLHYLTCMSVSFSCLLTLHTVPLPLSAWQTSHPSSLTANTTIYLKNNYPHGRFR